MRCYNCHKFFVDKKGDLQMHDKVLGSFIVPDVEYEECEGCKEHFYSSKTLKQIESVEAERKQELLLKMPLGDFIQASDVSMILNCSRQALHKHRRIRRDFIHWIKYGGKIWYHKQSVKMFKETGDGRFALAEITKDSSSKVIKFSEIYANSKHSQDIVQQDYENAGSSSFGTNQEQICENEIMHQG